MGSDTHCTSVTVALSALCNAGNATLTTVPSMKAMLEPRIVATSTQGPTALSHGDTGPPERMEPSAQGSRIALFTAERNAETGDQPLLFAISLRRGSRRREVENCRAGAPACQDGMVRQVG